jgi:DNA repair exonuclease SbcCD ATPase subunit
MDIETRLSELRNDISSIKAYRDILHARSETLKAKSEALKYKADLNQKSSEVIKKWLEDLLRANVESMSELVTSALKSIIYDQSLTFRIQQEPKFNRLSMRFLIEEDGIEADPMTSFGGGAAVVSSLVLRLAIMARLNMANLLLLDESMSALALRYIPLAADFMRQLAEEMGVNIFMVTHNEEFMANAHVAYEGYTEKGDDGLKSFRLRRRT